MSRNTISSTAAITLLLSTKVDLSHGAPALKKPLLLLLVIANMERGDPKALDQNRFHFSDLARELDELIRRFGGKEARIQGRPEQPFFHLKSDGFWHLRAPRSLSSGRPVIAELRDLASYASLRKDVWKMLRDPSMRRLAAQALLDHWWPETYHEEILNTLGLNLDPTEIPRAVLTAAEQAGNSQTTRASRSPDFAFLVKLNFRHACAFCGFRSTLGIDHFGLEAAHIHWRSLGGPDLPENGLALCRMHHAAFDFGILGVSSRGTILVSRRFAAQDPVSKLQIEDIKDKPVAQGKDTQPHDVFLEWHRDKIFDDG